MFNQVYKLAVFIWTITLVPLTQAGDSAFEAYPQSEVENYIQSEGLDYELGLGALQKTGGRWRFKESRRLIADAKRTTWKINEGYTAQEAFSWLAERLNARADIQFSCEGRSCGRSAQWADRVFQERLLYGHDDRQMYGVWKHSREGVETYYVLYASDRANRRHYVHMDVLENAAFRD